MDEPLDDRTETLLGKMLLGQATDEERRELETRRRASRALCEAMDLLEGSQRDWGRSAAGRTAPSAELPAYLRPERLAEGVRRWYWRWVLATAAGLVVLTPMILASASLYFRVRNPGGMALTTAVGAAALLLVAALVAHHVRGGVAERIAAGGESWDRTVAAVRRQERLYLSPVARAIAIASGAAALGLSLAAGDMSGKPAGATMFAAAVLMGVTLRIAKRRFLLRGLLGPGGGLL